MPTASDDGDGVDVDGLVALTNNGTITATGHTDGNLAEALAIGGGSVVNHGTIDQRRARHHASTTATSATPSRRRRSSTTALIRGGNGRGDLDHRHLCRHHHQQGHDRRAASPWAAATISLNDYIGSIFTATIDGGDGTDTFNLLGNGTGTLAHAVNFELLDVQGGQLESHRRRKLRIRHHHRLPARGSTIADGGALAGTVTNNGIFGVSPLRHLRRPARRSPAAARSTRPAPAQRCSARPTAIAAARHCMPARWSSRRAMPPAPAPSPSRTGAQTLKIDKAALDHGHLDNTIEGFGVGDTIDLAGIGKATQVTLSADNVLTITGGKSGTITLQLDSHAYASGLNFQLSSDGNGGTNITTVSDNLVAGTDGNNLLVAELFSSVGSFLDGKGGNDILIGGQHSDVLNGGGGNDLLYAGAGADQFRFNGTDQAAGQRATDTVFDLNFNKGDALVFYDYEAGTFASSGAHPATVLDTGEGAGSGTVVKSMAALVDLVNGSDRCHRPARRRQRSCDSTSARANGSHETIVLDHQCAKAPAEGGASHHQRPTTGLRRRKQCLVHGRAGRAARAEAEQADALSSAAGHWRSAISIQSEERAAALPHPVAWRDEGCRMSPAEGPRHRHDGAADPRRLARGDHGETAALFRLREDRSICILECESRHVLSISRGVGDSLRLTRVSSGKAMLAFMDPARQAELPRDDPGESRPRAARASPGIGETQRLGDEPWRNLHRHGRGLRAARFDHRGSSRRLGRPLLGRARGSTSTSCWNSSKAGAGAVTAVRAAGLRTARPSHRA